MTLVTVTGTFNDGQGNPLTLSPVFTPSQTVYQAGVPVVTPATPVNASAPGGVLKNSSGGPLTLLATDTTGLTIIGQTGFWFWTVTFPGSALPSFSFFLPKAVSPVDLLSLAGVAGSGGFANPMTTLGDLIYGGAGGVATRLPGDTSNTRKFLRELSAAGVATAPVWDTLLTGDIPQLPFYAPTGLTGVQVATRYAGGLLAGLKAPGSGTFLVGDWYVTTDGTVRICTVAGTPGTWRRAGSMPWQFFLDDYAKCDGQQCLVNVTSASATINTTPLAAPAAPTLATATTGGTIAAGTYTVALTYVNKYGETVASATATVTTTGSTSTITVTAPALSGNATGYYCYFSQVGQTTPLTRQQAAGSPTALTGPFILTAPPTSSGANPPGSNTTATPIFTSTAVDGGKNVMICGGLGTPGAPYIGTISTVTSPTQAVLADTNMAATVTGAAMFFASDDRLAVDSWLQDMQAYAQGTAPQSGTTGRNIVEGVVPDKFIGLGTGVFQSLFGSTTLATGETFNTQMRLPYANPSGQTEKLEVRLTGPGDNAHNYFWVSALPNLVGGTFVSFALGPAAADPNFGQQSIMAAPAGNFGAGSNAFSNTKYVIRGIQVVAPGWHNTIGIDLQDAAGFVLRGSSQVYAPTTSTGGGVNPSNNWVGNATWQSKIGAGLRAPNLANNDDCLIESFATEGVTTSILHQADHLIIQRLSTINTYFGMKITTGVNTHDLTILQWSYENLAGGAIQALGSGHIKCFIVMDGEQTAPVYDIQDNGNALYGIVYWSDPFRANGANGFQVPVIQGCANLDMRNGQMARQVYGAPAYTLGSATQNPWFHPMTITIAGGTVTGVSVGPRGGTLTALGITSGTFRLPANWDFNIAGSVKPTTFIAVPD